MLRTSRCHPARWSWASNVCAVVLFLGVVQTSCGFFQPATIAPSSKNLPGRKAYNPFGGDINRWSSCASRNPSRNSRSILSATSGNDTEVIETEDRNSTSLSTAASVIEAETIDPEDGDRAPKDTVACDPRPTGDAHAAKQDADSPHTFSVDMLDDKSKFALALTAAVVAAGAVFLQVGGRAAIVSALGLDFASQNPELKENVDSALTYLSSFDPLPKAMLFTLAWTAVKMLCFDAGASVLSLASGVLFGGVAQGAIASAAAATVGSSVTFGLARADSPVREKALETIEEYPYLRGVEKVVAKDGFKSVLTLRLAPILPIPIGMYNYIYGVTGVSFQDFALGTFVGSLKPALLDSYVGVFGKAVVDGTVGSESSLEDFILLIAFGVIILAGVFASQLAVEMWDSITEEMEIEGAQEGAANVAPFREMIEVNIPQIRQEAIAAVEKAKEQWAKLDFATKASVTAFPLLGVAVVGGQTFGTTAFNPIPGDPGIQLSLLLVLILGAPELSLSAGAKFSAETERILNRWTGENDRPLLGSTSSNQSKRLPGVSEIGVEGPETSKPESYLLPEAEKMQKELDDLTITIDAVQDFISKANNTNEEQAQEPSGGSRTEVIAKYPNLKRRNVDAPAVNGNTLSAKDVILSPAASPIIEVEAYPSPKPPVINPLDTKAEKIDPVNKKIPSLELQPSYVPPSTISAFPRPVAVSAPEPRIGSGVVLTRREKLVFDYKVASAAFAAASLSILGFSGSCFAPALLSASGPVVASGIAWILRGAAENDGLGSDTYKRLNLSLAAFSLCGILTGILSLSSYNARDLGFTGVFLASLLAISPSTKGWAYGVGGVASRKRIHCFLELVGGAFRTIKGLVVVRSWKSVGYLAATIFAGATEALAVFETASLLKAEADCRAVVTRLARLARFTLLTAVSFVLKDAADRGRLNGNTFIRLNFLSAFAFGSIAVSAYRYMGFSFYGPAARAVECSGFCLYHATVCLAKNKGKI